MDLQVHAFPQRYVHFFRVHDFLSGRSSFSWQLTLELSGFVEWQPFLLSCAYNELYLRVREVGDFFYDTFGCRSVRDLGLFTESLISVGLHLLNLKEELGFVWSFIPDCASPRN